MRIGILDRRVILAFCQKEPAEGHKLHTDGTFLHGYWMGGHGIAQWEGGSIRIHDLGSRSAQTVQRAVQRCAAQLHKNPTFWIQKALGGRRRKGALHRQLGIPTGEKIPLNVLEQATHAPGKLGRRARLAKTLRRLGRKGR